MQFSLFGAAAVEPVIADLDGIVLAGGHWVSAAVDGVRCARLSVLVDAAWRADALVGELLERGLDAEQVPNGHAGEQSGLIDVRTALSAELLVGAERWTRGARISPPPDFVLSPGGLRLWAIARGTRDDAGYLLGTPAVDGPLHRVAGAQLAGVGLTAVSLGERGHAGWRITGIKRIRP